MEVNELRRIAGALFEQARVRLDWPEPTDSSARLAIEGGKLALNLILLAAGALPRGGTVTVGLGEAGEALEIMVSAGGERVAMDQEVAAVLRTGAEGAAIEPHTAQPYLTARLVQSLGAKIEVSMDPDRLELHAAIAAAAPSD